MMTAQILLDQVAHLPKLSDSAVLLLVRHIRGQVFAPETAQDRTDMERLKELGYIQTYLRDTSATITGKGCKRVQLEAEGILRHLSLKKVEPDVIAEKLNSVGFRTRSGKRWDSFQVILVLQGLNI